MKDWNWDSITQNLHWRNHSEHPWEPLFSLQLLLLQMGMSTGSLKKHSLLPVYTKQNFCHQNYFNDTIHYTMPVTSFGFGNMKNNKMMETYFLTVGALLWKLNIAVLRLNLEFSRVADLNPIFYEITTIKQQTGEH